MHDLFDICDYDETEHASASMPLIGDMAPEFSASTTNGHVNFPGDYAGKWVILFSHPADFTPVCTSEFMAFQALTKQLHELNTELIGLSVGTLSGHLAWLGAIRDIQWRGWRDMEITFPLIDDMKMEIAKKYGMIQPNASNTHAVRAVFIIDPVGKIRAILYYPLTTGRNFDEILRILIALQTTDAFGAPTPADWMPGDDVLAPAPATVADMRKLEQRPPRDLDVRAWFMSFRKLPAETIYEKLTRASKQSKSKSKAKPKSKQKKK